MLAVEGSVCENLDLPVNEYVARVSEIPIVSRKISDRDRNMRAGWVGGLW